MKRLSAIHIDPIKVLLVAFPDFLNARRRHRHRPIGATDPLIESLAKGEVATRVALTTVRVPYDPRRAAVEGGVAVRGEGGGRGGGEGGGGGDGGTHLECV